MHEFPVGSAAECPQCADTVGEAAERDAEARRGVESERQALAVLSQGMTATLEAGVPYYLVPRCVRWCTWCAVI